MPVHYSKIDNLKWAHSANKQNSSPLSTHSPLSPTRPQSPPHPLSPPRPLSPPHHTPSHPRTKPPLTTKPTPGSPLGAPPKQRNLENTQPGANRQGKPETGAHRARTQQRNSRHYTGGFLPSAVVRPVGRSTAALPSGGTPHIVLLLRRSAGLRQKSPGP